MGFGDPTHRNGWRPAALLALMTAIGMTLAGCVETGAGGHHRAQQVSIFERQDSIGTAYMRNDRVIILDLRAEDPYEGIHGHGEAIYPPGHPSYKDILRHLGGLTPGETKPVSPWLD